MTQAEVLFKNLKQQIKEYGETYPHFQDEDLFTLWFMRAYVTESEQEAGSAIVSQS